MIKRRLQVPNSNIAEIGYDSDTMTMEVVFRDNLETIYTYSNVGTSTFCDLVNADSVGSLFASTIRKSAKAFPFTKRAEARPMPPREQAIETIVADYRIGLISHNHVTREVKPIGGGCPACDVNHLIEASRK